MPSPFPGMDPYLEDPRSWPDVHNGLLTEIRDTLGRRLPPHYVVRVEDRVYVSDEYDVGRGIYMIPDVVITPNPRHEDGPRPTDPDAEVAEPLTMTTWIEDEIHEHRLVLKDLRTNKVVTIIEVLSPANKVVGSAGRRSYRMKWKQAMMSGTNLVEIDLLRRGKRLYPVGGLPPCEYLVHVSKRVTRPLGWIWPIRLSQRLPTIRIPISPGEEDVFLNLQEILDSIFQRREYDRQTDYTKPPVPPLKREWIEWADQLLREKGLRSS